MPERLNSHCLSPLRRPRFSPIALFACLAVIVFSGRILAQRKIDNRRPPSPTSTALELSARGHILETQGNEVAVREMPGTRKEGRSVRPPAGKPDIEQRLINVLLPYDADLSTIEIRIPWDDGVEGRPDITSLGTHDVRPVSLAQSYDPGSNTTEVEVPDDAVDGEGKDPSIYGNDEFWPPLPFRVVGQSSFRQYRSLLIAFSPYQWNPVTRELRKIENLKVDLNWQRRVVNPQNAREALGDPFRLLPDDVRWVNAEIALPWYQYLSRIAAVDYLIITTGLIRWSSSQLPAFIAHKQDQGYRVSVVTMSVIQSAYPAGEAADSIRAFLKDKYGEWGYRYLLLIGDPDPDNPLDTTDSVGSVPMKIAWPRGDGVEDIPTDHYFADLSGDWDIDGDGLAASWEDDYVVRTMQVDLGTHVITWSYNDYGVDNEGELLVGRIPWDDVSRIDTLLQATINYQTADLDDDLKAVRERVYLAMSEFSPQADTSYLGHQIQSNVTHPEGLTTFSLYEPTAHYTGSHSLESAALISLWTGKGAGLVAWTGHGALARTGITYDDSDLMTSWDAPNLNAYPRAYVVQGSCNNAWPESSSNLSASLLENVAVGTFAGTRLSWYREGRTSFGSDSKIEDIVWHLTRNLVSDHSAGYALDAMRLACVPTSEIDLQNILTYNLHGDPVGRYRRE